jgi:hypothetical protein
MWHLLAHTGNTFSSFASTPILRTADHPNKSRSPSLDGARCRAKKHAVFELGQSCKKLMAVARRIALQWADRYPEAKRKPQSHAPKAAKEM